MAYESQDSSTAGSRMASAQSEIGFPSPGDHHKVQTTAQPKFKPTLLNWYEAEVLHRLSLRKKESATYVLKISKLDEEMNYIMERRRRLNSLTWLSNEKYVEMNYEFGRLYYNLTPRGKYLAEIVKVQRTRKSFMQLP